MPKQKLYLIDSSIYVFRAWFSLPDSLQTVSDEPNNALIGFTDFVYSFLQQQKPKKMVFAFDESLHNCPRKAVYPEYKANRQPAPKELKRQFRWCRDWLDLLGISQTASQHYEADDLIGSLASTHRNEQQAIVILTADKDLAQLIREDDLWWSWTVGQQFSYRGISKKFGVLPEQIADQLALAGDKIDNIPGIPGVGMTIAARLLTRFGSLDNLRGQLDAVAKMKFRGAKRVRDLLIEHQSVLDISSKLTGIFCDVEAVKSIKIERQEPDLPGLEKMMQYQRIEGSRRQKWLELLQGHWGKVA